MMPRQVVRFDLRGQDGPGALAGVRALLDDEEQTDLTMLLVIDDAAAVREHQRAYETLLPSPFTEDVLCVLVGRAAGEPPRLELPGGLVQAAGVLWVSDPAGINWRLSTAASVTRRPKGTDPEAGLHRLLELLSLPGVFTETLRLVQRVPGRVANPGLRLAGVGGEPSDFSQLLAAAIDRTLHAGPARPPDPAAFDDHPPAPGPVRLRPGGPLWNAFEQARQTVAEAEYSAEELSAGRSLLAGAPPADEDTAAAGERLGLLRERLETLFAGAHSAVGLGPAQEEAIDRAGVELPDREEFDAGRTRNAIEKYLAEGLDGAVALPKLVDGLERRQAELIPRGSRSFIPELRRVCPDDLISRLRTPGPVPGPEVWLPLVGLIAAALAGLTPFGLISGVGMAVLWTGLVAFTVLRAPGGRPPGAAAALAVNAAAGLIGGVGAALAVPALGAVGWVPATLVALGCAAGAVLRSWQARTRRWATALGLDQAAQAIDELREVLSQAAREWSRASARIAAADAVARMGAALGQIADELGDRLARLRENLTDGARPDPRTEHHLATLVRTAMADPLYGLADGSAAEHGERARRGTAELLARWEEHAAEHGPLVPPPFAAERRSSAAAAPPAELAGLAEAASGDLHDVMWQLCAGDDLMLLDAGAPQTGVVRFAPRHIRPTAEDLLPTDTVWVPSTRHAGMLRLVPVRPGITVQIWAEGPESGEKEAR